MTREFAQGFAALGALYWTLIAVTVVTSCVWVAG